MGEYPTEATRDTLAHLLAAVPLSARGGADRCEIPGPYWWPPRDPPPFPDLGDCDTDQPLPLPGEGDCWAELMSAMGAEHPLHGDAEARRALGIARYGRPLQRGNGRSIKRDIHEERLDLAVYLWAGGRHRAALGLLDASWLDRLERP